MRKYRLFIYEIFGCSSAGTEYVNDVIPVEVTLPKAEREKLSDFVRKFFGQDVEIDAKDDDEGIVFLRDSYKDEDGKVEYMPKGTLIAEDSVIVQQFGWEGAYAYAFPDHKETYISDWTWGKAVES